MVTTCVMPAHEQLALVRHQVLFSTESLTKAGIWLSDDPAVNGVGNGGLAEAGVRLSWTLLSQRIC